MNLEKSSREIGKRGQVTVFIILGIMIVFAAFLVGYLQNETFRQKIESSLFGGLVVPEQAKSVVNYLESCIGTITENGVELLGNRAGYIELPDYINSNPRTYLDVAGVKIPYWLYGESNVDIPTKEEMEFQLKEYIEGRFGECDLNQFRERGYEFRMEEVKVKVDISDDEVRVKLVSDIKTRVKDKTYEVDDYILVSLNKPLGKLWKIGRDFIDRELRNKPLEFNTLNLIGAYSKDKDYFPPIAGFDFKCGGRSWNYTGVKERAKEFLSAYLPYLRVEGSKNEKDFEDEFYKSMVINKLGFENLRGVEIGFNYFEDWPMFFDVYPRDGEILKVGGLNWNVPFFGLLCNNLYNFRYTMLYPVLITFEKERFRFNMPVEVYLVDNYGRENVWGDTAEDLGEIYSATNSLFCDEDQKLSGEVSLEIKDGLNSQAVENAQIRYVCGFESCTMGESPENGIFVSKFPLCKGGELNIEKEGYLVYRGGFDARVDSNTGKVVILEPLRNKKVSIRVFEVDREGVIGEERDLRDDEEVHLEISKVNEDLLGFDKREAFVVKGNVKEDIEIVPGDYMINAQLNLNKKIVLSEEVIEGVKFEGRELEGAVTGGIKVSDFYLDKKRLEGANELVVYVVSYGEPTKLEDINRAFEVEGFDLEPTLK